MSSDRVVMSSDRCAGRLQVTADRVPVTVDRLQGTTDQVECSFFIRWYCPVSILSRIQSVRSVGEGLSVDCGIEPGRGNGNGQEEHDNDKRFEGY
ncbi:hypothetical protein OROMI_020637 [Orobanche minor]